MRCNGDAGNSNWIPTQSKPIYINIFMIPTAKEKVCTEIHMNLAKTGKNKRTQHSKGSQKQYQNNELSLCGVLKTTFNLCSIPPYFYIIWGNYKLKYNIKGL